MCFWNFGNMFVHFLWMWRFYCSEGRKICYLHAHQIGIHMVHFTRILFFALGGCLSLVAFSLHVCYWLWPPTWCMPGVVRGRVLHTKVRRVVAHILCILQLIICLVRQ